MDLQCDYLIIGGGIAGLRAALELSRAGTVLVLTKAAPSESNTGYAQGGIAAALGSGDAPELHAADTIAAGHGLCNPEAVRVMVHEGPRYVRELVEWGAQFERTEDGTLALAREGAHSVPRVLHAQDATGREISRVLWQRVSATPAVQVISQATAARLEMEGGICTGVQYIGANGMIHRVVTQATLLATGGAGQVYRETTNPSVATGDGLAIGYRAGARVVDLEFVQFHPTVLDVPGAPRFLLSEALRGEGARLVNASGEAFMSRYDAAGDLASRDIVSRAMVTEARRTDSGIFLSLAHLAPDFVRRRFPLITKACAAAGLDLTVDRIPLSPAAHYLMGGLETDLWGRTSVARLYAAGEVACTGVHGANRLGSNSLLEGLVFGARAGDAMRADTGPDLGRVRKPPEGRQSSPRGGRLDQWTSAEILAREVMWRDVGLIRDRVGLSRALRQLEELDNRLSCSDPQQPIQQLRTRNLITVARLIARAALRREESRGGHYRSDFPAPDDLHWKRHISERLDHVSA